MKTNLPSRLKSILFLVAVLLLAAGLAHAQDDTNQLPPEIVSLIKNLKYQHGTIDLRGGLATLNVPKEFVYLGPDDAETVLVKLWGNEPSPTKPLGMLLPAGVSPIDTKCWAVTIDYSEDGYVKDTDASKINYDDLLKKMQKAIADNNDQRRKKGYPAITLVGWAAPPHYDAATHKLYWAKDLKVEGADRDTLNYSIRMLGRRGVLELNAIADLSQFPTIDQQTPQILGMVDFKDGNRYADFDPKIDKVATYGIAALVAGGIAAKAGLFTALFKGIWILILAAKKFVILAVVGIAAFFKKLFNRDGSRGSGSGPTT